MGRRMKWRLCVATTLAAVALAAVLAPAARVEYGNLVITANGGFHPNTLPRNSYAPIRIYGHATIKTKDGTTPPPLQSILFLIDRNGHLETRGLPVCQPGKLANTTVEQARAACKNAIVGTGTVKAIITLPGQPPVPSTSPLTFFNGSRQGGNATVVIHAYTTVPEPTTYVVVTTIEKVHKGRFGYQVSTDIPSIAGGYGSLTAGSFKIKRVYNYKGHTYGYTSARCTDGVLQARGRFTFTDGTIIEGSVFVPCNIRD
jgi:hypothetical protein